MSEPQSSPPREPPAAQTSPPGAATSAGTSQLATFEPDALPTQVTYVTVAGPSGVKQCFRSVKTVRRVPTLPKKLPQQPQSEEASTRERGDASTERSKRHPCTTCDKVFSSPGKLHQHALSHTGELPFSCELCDKRFNSKFKLVRHGLIHSEARAFSCPVCAKTFNRKDHLNNHVRVHNPIKKVHRCERPDCRKQYTSLLSYRKHAALHAAEEGCLQCKICSKTFADRDDIVHHLKVHTGSRSVKSETDKKFSCSYCDRKFFTGKDVRRHLVVHTGRRDFICQFCPQKFGRKDHLVRHVKNAHSEEAWSSTPSTSRDPDPDPRLEPKIEMGEAVGFPTYSTVHFDDLFPEEQSNASEVSVPTLVGDISVEEVKIEPLDVEAETVDLHFGEHSLSPQPGPSREVLTSELTSPIEYPMYMMQPPEYPLIGMMDQEILLEGDEQPVLASEIMELMQPDREPAEQGTTLPTFTKAFQSTAPSRQPPPP